MIVVVRVKGGFKMKKGFKDTLKMLRLNKNHHCVLLPDTPVNAGMIKKVQHMVTWGEIDEPTLKALIVKRGRVTGDKKVELKDKELDSLVKDVLSGKKTLVDAGIKRVFRLSPPKRGWERGTTKLRYPRGALGPRGPEINKLIMRML